MQLGSWDERPDSAGGGQEDGAWRERAMRRDANFRIRPNNADVYRHLTMMQVSCWKPLIPTGVSQQPPICHRPIDREGLWTGYA